MSEIKFTQTVGEAQPKADAAPQTVPDEKPKATEAPKPELSSQYFDLARKERAIRAKAQELKARELALTSKDAEYKSRYIDKEQLKADPIAALQAAGYTPEQIAELSLKPGKDPVTSELEALRAEIASMKKGGEDAQTQQYQAALNQIEKDVTQLVAKDENFEAVRAHGKNGIKEVVNLIERVFKEQGEILSNEEAAQLLEDEYLNNALKLAGLKKVKDKLAATSKPTVETAPETVQDEKQAALTQALIKGPQKMPGKIRLTSPAIGMKTLTNSTSTTKPMTARERAILAFRGELK